MEGLIPVATTTKNGLMSAVDKTRMFNIFYVSSDNKLCYEVGDLRPWEKGFVFIVFSNNEYCEFYSVGYWNKYDGTGLQCKFGKFTDRIAPISIYTKEEKVFIECASNIHMAWLYTLSPHGVKFIGENIIDDSYTLIPAG